MIPENKNIEKHILLTFHCAKPMKASRRNDLHHHGFKEDNALLNRDKPNEIKERWQEIKNSLTDKEKWKLAPNWLDGPEEGSLDIPENHTATKGKAGTGGILLVSPLGLSRGLLYSALCHIHPMNLVVISSSVAALSFEEVVQKACWLGESKILIMQDPHSGFSEAESLAEAVLPVCRHSGQIVVNITGGTTAMQHVVQQIASRAREMGLPVQLAALVDRRPPQEQRDNPYVRGELIYLDRNKEG
ncbi:MAG: hypothetical protein GX425_08175 [Peptococcaceae bacterium]|nr:hypothetical protein [Peptococcaceae bacterium]